MLILTKAIFISIAIAVLGFIPLMGLPGVLILPLSKPFIYLMHGPMAFEASTQSLGDKAWPLMLMLSVLWPISIPIAYLICQKLFGDLTFFSPGFLIPFIAVVLFGATIISTLTVKMNLDVKRLSDTEILESALKNGKLDLVKEHWNLTNNPTFNFGDPLFVTIENKQTKVAMYLLEQGVNPNNYTQDSDQTALGITPLHTATKNGMIIILKKILELGADPNVSSAKGHSPLHNLGDKDDKMLPVLDLLKKSGANFAAIDKDGNTPLISLVMINAPLEHRPLLAKKLIEYGCPKDALNKKGETALSIVQKQQPYESELIAVLSETVQ